MKTILVALDFSDATRDVVATAVRFAVAFDSKLVLVHVAEPEPEFVGFETGPEAVRKAIAREVRDEHRQLEELRAELVEQGLQVVALQIQGPTVEKLSIEAGRLGAGLIVLGSHSHGALYRLFKGNLLAELLRSAPCPVLVVPGRADNP